MFSVLMLSVAFARCGLSSAQVNDDWQTSYRNGLEDFLKTGQKTPQLESALSGLEFPRVFRKKLGNVEKKLTDTLLCDSCRIALQVAISGYRLGIPKSAVVKTIGLVDNNIDIIAYIIDNRPQLDSKKICSMLLQDYHCQDPDRVNWTIYIPSPTVIHSDAATAQESRNNISLKILHLTDIHFDPYYAVDSNANCELPLCCQPGTKPKTRQDAAGYWGDYRFCNTPWRTIENLFDHVLLQHKNLDYVYFTGDIIRHKVWATNITSNSEAITKLYKKFKDTFVTVPVYPILGNHEPHPLNQFSSEGINSHELSTQWVFDLVAELWNPWLSPETGNTIRRGGYYTVLVRPGFRIVALNSNVCYTFNWWLLFDDKDPFGQLQWLVNTLLDAEAHKEKVHILSHIPTSESHCLQNWGWEYSKIINRFSHIITAQFNGHTHADDTTLFFNVNRNDEAINVAYNGGGITTYNDLNPNYKVFDVDSETLEVSNYESWIFNLTEANLNPRASPRWYMLYDFKSTYGVDNLQPSVLVNLVKRMAVYKNLTRRYFRHKIKNSDAVIYEGCDSECERENLCYMVTFVHGHNWHCQFITKLYNSVMQ